MAGTKKAKRGRPKVPEDRARRNAFTFRTSDDLARQIKRSAAKSGRSYAQEIEFLVEQALNAFRQYGDGVEEKLLRAMLSAAHVIEDRGGSKVRWYNSFVLSNVVRSAWNTMLSKISEQVPELGVFGGDKPIQDIPEIIEAAPEKYRKPIVELIEYAVWLQLWPSITEMPSLAIGQMFPDIKPKLDVLEKAREFRFEFPEWERPDFLEELLGFEIVKIEMPEPLPHDDEFWEGAIRQMRKNIRLADYALVKGSDVGRNFGATWAKIKNLNGKSEGEELDEVTE